MNFPIISLLKSDSFIYAAPTEKNLKRASIDLIDIFRDALIIDSDGIEYLISKAYKIGWATLLWGYNPLIKGRTAKIDFEIKKSNQISLEDLKTILSERINRKYSKHLYFDLDKQDMLERIKNRKSFKELVELFLYAPEVPQ